MMLSSTIHTLLEERNLCCVILKERYNKCPKSLKTKKYFFPVLETLQIMLLLEILEFDLDHEEKKYVQVQKWLLSDILKKLQCDSAYHC